MVGWQGPLGALPARPTVHVPGTDQSKPFARRGSFAGRLMVRSHARMLMNFAPANAGLKASFKLSFSWLPDPAKNVSAVSTPHMSLSNPSGVPSATGALHFLVEESSI